MIYVIGNWKTYGNRKIVEMFRDVNFKSYKNINVTLLPDEILFLECEKNIQVELGLQNINEK